MRSGWRFWAARWRVLRLTAALMLGSGIGAYVYAGPLEGVLGPAVAQVFAKIGAGDGVLPSGSELFIRILLSNLLAVVFAIAGGVVFGLIPLWSAVLNGALIGFLLAKTAEQGFSPVAMFVYGILPHGLFELPAMILAAAYGLVIGGAVIRSLVGGVVGRRDDRFSAGWRAIAGAFWPTIVAIVSLLIVAAAVESFVTVPLVEGAFRASR
ncbi:stage II sporulation protein M [Hydrogenibacillus sp. N12]|uniref:stage II sporulation protein M n=1 Tax=Hydrogenibacillus sp. N12 TaxID=2866627 RepID=UPI001C7CC7C0|nr:stage II sporulation protein M [Hydrogenibacillus sp. N12]QZA33744.1 stage II sporulation protein M [Hydrogenibacillus sp. N12]